MFQEIAENINLPFCTFHTYPPITDRRAWSSADQEWLEASVRLGEQYLSCEFPPISASDFMDFVRTGNRIRYEDKYFSRRRMLNALVLAECAENKGRFLNDIINGIFFICEESAWQLPPHNSYQRNTPQLPLPDVTAPVLDLFACETGCILATIYYLMGSLLDTVSPFITKRIQHELQNRILTPYLNRQFWWMGNGKEPMNNWTIWCTQNILLITFLTSAEEALSRKVLTKACKSIDYFLDEYGEDGCCDEGALYYRHSGLCLFNSMELLNTVTGNAFQSLYQNRKIQNIAAYILHVHVEDPYYVNFSDCSPVAGRAGVREYLFAKRTGNEDMARFAAIDFKADLPNSLLLSDEINLFYRLQHACSVREIKAADTTVPVVHTDIYYPSTGLFIVRDEHRYLAVKAGDNADSHNHNDTGSFTIYKNGQPLIIDVGVESYTMKTFSSQRYEIWTMQSAYHNLPTINKIMQKDGESYRAEQVSYQLNSSFGEISMELAKAYPPECRLLYYRRHAKLTKGKVIEIEDQFEFSPEAAPDQREVILSLMTYDKPAAGTASSSIELGTKGSIRLEGAVLYKIEEIPITDPRLMTAWKHEIYRILIRATAERIRLSIR